MLVSLDLFSNGHVSNAAPLRASLHPQPYPLIPTPTPPVYRHCLQTLATQAPLSSSIDLPPFDLVIPIAYYKGKQSSTIHPISHYVSYHHLSNVNHAYVTCFSFVIITKNCRRGYTKSYVEDNYR